MQMDVLLHIVDFELRELKLICLVYAVPISIICEFENFSLFSHGQPMGWQYYYAKGLVQKGMKCRYCSLRSLKAWLGSTRALKDINSSIQTDCLLTRDTVELLWLNFHLPTTCIETVWTSCNIIWAAAQCGISKLQCSMQLDGDSSSRAHHLPFYN